MNEKINTTSTEVKQEQTPIPEQPGVEREISEEEFQEKLEQATSEIENSQSEVITSTEDRTENAPASFGLGEEKAAEIYKQGGFAENIDATKKQIIELGEQTKAQIENLMPEFTGESEKGQKYESVKEYTKEQTPEERKILAEKIIGLRREKFQSERESGQKIAELLRNAEEKKLAAEEAIKQIRDSE